MQVHPEQAELRQLRDDLAGQDPLLEPVAHVRQDPFAHELAHRVANRAFLVVEQCIQSQKIVWIEHGRGAAGGGHETEPPARQNGHEKYIEKRQARSRPLGS